VHPGTLMVGRHVLQDVRRLEGEILADANSH
jgi:hypothetical protein